MKDTQATEVPMATHGEWTPLDKGTLEHFQQRLLEERRRLLRVLDPEGDMMAASVTTDDGDLTNWPFHLADQATDTIEQETGFALASRESRMLSAVDAALQRLYASPETFGRCENCGRAIELDRLDAIPHARLCATCMKRMEAGARPGDEARP